MAHIDSTKSQTIYYPILKNSQIIRHKLSINFQKQSMNNYLEIPSIKKSLIYLNINTKKTLEAVDTPLSNYSLIKPVPNKYKKTDSVILFGLICLSAEQFPQKLEKDFCNY